MVNEIESLNIEKLKQLDLKRIIEEGEPVLIEGHKISIK